MLIEKAVFWAFVANTTTPFLDGNMPFFRPMVLNKELFNRNFYQRVQTVFFGGVPDGATMPSFDVMKRWWFATGDEKASFDETCRSSFVKEIQAIGPQKDTSSSSVTEAIAESFLREIGDAAKEYPGNDGFEGAKTALSILVLLDQMTRNIYRTPATLPLIYNHYDKISQSILRSLLSGSGPIPRPDEHPMYRLSAAHRTWFYLPLMHSEDMKLHRIAIDTMAIFRSELESAGDKKDEIEYLDRQIKFENEHAVIVEKFGRYPHRNKVLGREPTPEEKKYMEEGGETFGVTTE